MALSLRGQAYHEAGHAVVGWLFDWRSDHIEIDLAPNDRGALAHVVLAADTDPAESVAWQLSISRTAGRASAARHIVRLFAGPSAENKIGDNFPATAWMAAELLASNLVGHDANRAVDVANQIHLPESKRHWNYLAALATWTDELLAESRVWEAIAALAAQLVSERRVDGDDAYMTIGRAFYAGDACYADPMKRLGPKWRRRFFPKIASKS